MNPLMKSKINIVCGLSLVALSACDQGAMTVSEYKENPDQIAVVLSKCDENPKDHLTEDRCINAKAAKAELQKEKTSNTYLSLEDFERLEKEVNKHQ